MVPSGYDSGISHRQNPPVGAKIDVLGMQCGVSWCSPRQSSGCFWRVLSQEAEHIATVENVDANFGI